jgi:ABC-type bacteriocin/lantibiotic exporter with double-glycine peptidase domain
MVSSQELGNTIIRNESLEFQELIRLKRDTFQYEASDFRLRNIQIEIKKNDKVALVGKSGIGKSTLAKLIMGIIKPEKGSLFVDENEINEYNLKAWQKNIAYVPQDSFIFKGSLFENITMGDELNQVNQLKVIELLHLMELTEMTKNHEAEIFMDLGENGENISGGQRQRIAIARALYLEKPVIFFDEVTSNLDEINRKKVVKNILKIMQMNKTVIFITHQQEIINACNVVLDIEKFNRGY